jgi:hypothetical protein
VEEGGIDALKTTQNILNTFINHHFFLFSISDVSSCLLEAG